MKILIKLMSALTLSSIAISPVVACGDLLPNSTNPTPQLIKPKGLPANEDKLHWKFVADPKTIQSADDKIYLLIYKNITGKYENLYLKTAEKLEFEIEHDSENQWFYSWDGDDKCAGATVNANTGEIENWEIVNSPKSILSGDNSLYLLIYKNRKSYNTVKIKNNSDLFMQGRTNQEILQTIINKTNDIKHIYRWSESKILDDIASYPIPQINANTGEIIY